VIDTFPAGAKLVTHEHEVFVAYPDGKLKRLHGTQLITVE